MPFLLKGTATFYLALMKLLTVLHILFFLLYLIVFSDVESFASIVLFVSNDLTAYAVSVYDFHPDLSLSVQLDVTSTKSRITFRNIK